MKEEKVKATTNVEFLFFFVLSEKVFLGIMVA